MSPQERAEQARSRRLLVHKLSEAIRDADRGKTDDLCDLLCKLIPDPEGGLLAELIERKMKLGRKPRYSSPSEEMEKKIVAIVDARRTRSTEKPLARGTLDKWIDEVGTRLAEDGEFQGLQVNRENIKAALERGKKKQAPKVANSA